MELVKLPKDWRLRIDITKFGLNLPSKVVWGDGGAHEIQSRLLK